MARLFDACTHFLPILICKDLTPGGTLCVLNFILSMDKLQLKGQNPGRVFNSRLGRACICRAIAYTTKQPNLKLKTRPKQLLDFPYYLLMLVISLGWFIIRIWKFLDIFDFIFKILISLIHINLMWQHAFMKYIHKLNVSSTKEGKGEHFWNKNDAIVKIFCFNLSAVFKIHFFIKQNIFCCKLTSVALNFSMPL